MIILTGQMGGKTYADQQVSAKDIVEALELPEIDKYAEFTLTDMLRGQRIGDDKSFAAGLNLSPTYILQLPEGTLSITYTTDRRPIAGGLWDNTTKRVQDFKGETLAFVKGQPGYDVEKFVWFFLHPLQGTNPYRKVNRGAMFTYADREGEAKAKNLAHASMLDVMLKIGSAEIGTLRVLAKGLRYTVNGEQRVVSRVNEIGPEELRRALLDMAQADGQAFVSAFMSGENTIVGMLQTAIDAGFITLKAESWGKSWMWNTTTHQGSLIVSVRQGESDFGALQAAFADNYNDLMPLLHGVINSLRVGSIADEQQLQVQSVEQATAEQLKTMSIERIVNELFDRDAIGFDRGSLSVMYVDENGGFSGDPIVTLPNGPSWRQAFMDFVVHPAQQDLRNHFADLLQAKVQPSVSADIQIPTQEKAPVSGGSAAWRGGGGRGKFKPV